MKKLFLILILIILVNVSLFSQEDDYKFTIQASPLLYFYDLIYLGVMYDKEVSLIMDLEGQYKINDRMNLSLTAAFILSGTQYYYYGRNEFQMIFKPMFIYRPNKTGLKGFYLGISPIIGWYSLKEWDTDDYLDEVVLNKNILDTRIGLGFNIGYKWVFNNGFTLQLGGGISKKWSVPSSTSEYYYDFYFSPDGSIMLPNFDLQILDFKLGYTFPVKKR